MEVRKELTDEWQRAGINGTQYASLTDIITQEWSGRTTKEYKNLKGLKKENLRDNMTNLELALSATYERYRYKKRSNALLQPLLTLNLIL